ncbi:MAG: LptF/LptG family permease [Planctomycetota bacterium]
MRWKPPRIGILDAYVARRFLAIYASNLFVFTLIFVLVDTVSHFDEFARGDRGAGEAFALWCEYYVAVVPVVFCQILGPVVTVSAALLAVTTFQRANEFVPVLATGRSYQRALVPILAASAAVSAGTFLVQELWVPRSVESVARMREAVRGSRDVLKDVVFADEAYGQLIVFGAYYRGERRAEKVIVLPTSRRGDRHVLVHAASAEWIRPEVPGRDVGFGYWLLRDGTIQEYDEDYDLVPRPPPPETPGAPPKLFERFAALDLRTALIPQDLEKKDVVHMSLAELRRRAKASGGQNVWSVRYYSRFAYAATNFTLVLLGLPIVVAFGARNAIVGALLAVGIASLYFVSNSVFQDLGIRGHISAALGGGLAPCLFLSLGCTLYREMRT